MYRFLKTQTNPNKRQHAQMLIRALFKLQIQSKNSSKALREGNVFACVCLFRRGRPPTLPQRDTDTPGYGQQAGGTHPTRIHTCFKMILSQPNKKKHCIVLPNKTWIKGQSVVLKLINGVKLRNVQVTNMNAYQLCVASHLILWLNPNFVLKHTLVLGCLEIRQNLPILVTVHKQVGIRTDGALGLAAPVFERARQKANDRSNILSSMKDDSFTIFCLIFQGQPQAYNATPATVRTSFTTRPAENRSIHTGLVSPTLSVVERLPSAQSHIIMVRTLSVNHISLL